MLLDGCFFQAEDGIRYLVRSRGLGDVYKRQMQEAGEPLRLQYIKHHYGPYAENLRHVLKAVEGHLIAGYADGGDAPDKPLTLVPGAVEDAKNYLDQHDISRAHFERVTKLVEGFESPYLSLIHISEPTRPY